MKRQVDTQADILMKRIFSLQDIIEEIRYHQGIISLATIPVYEIYNIFIEVIDTLRFIRKQSDQLYGHRNPSLKDDPEPFSNVKFNVGGLINVKTGDFTLPASTEELDFLESIQVQLITMKNLLREASSQTHRIEKRSAQGTLPYRLLMVSEHIQGKSRDRDTILKDFGLRISGDKTPVKSKKRRRKAKYFATKARHTSKSRKSLK